MLKSLPLTAAPFIILLALMSGCSAEQTQATPPSLTPIPSLPTKPAPILITSSPPVLPLTDPFQDASDKAIGAATISQSAQSKDDWDLAFDMWQTAITLMKAVPKSSSNYSSAQKKVAEYQRNLASAKQQAVKPASDSDLTVAQAPSFSSTIAVSQAPSATTNTVSPELSQVAQEVIDEFFAIDSRLDVGMNYQEYGNQVAELKVALDKFGRRPGAKNSPVYARLSSALTNYETALTTWKMCIKEYSCSNDFIEASSKTGKFLLSTYKIPTADKEPSFGGKSTPELTWASIGKTKSIWTLRFQ